MIRKIVRFAAGTCALCFVAFTGCAQADNDDAGAGANVNPLCSKFCSKAVQGGCSPCDEISLDLCQQDLASVCGPERRAFIECALSDVIMCTDDIPQLERCAAQGSAEEQCFTDKADSCQYAKDGICDEGGKCLFGSDFTDCAGAATE